MKSVYKYTFQPGNVVDLLLPDGAVILSCQMQYNVITIWALVDPTALLTHRFFRVLTTGHPITDEEAKDLEFIDTVQSSSGNDVYHIFEIK